MAGSIEEAYVLFSKHMPPEAELEIIETDGSLICKYLFRATYSNKKRKMTITTKSDKLPENEFDLLFHLVRLKLTPEQQKEEFRILAWQEKRLRQIRFLNGDKTIKVSG